MDISHSWTQNNIRKSQNRPCLRWYPPWSWCQWPLWPWWRQGWSLGTISWGWAQMFWIQLSSNFKHIWNPKLPRHSGRGDFMFYRWHSENRSFWLESSGENFAQPLSKFKEIERCGAIPTLNARWPFASGIHHSFTSKKSAVNGEILGEFAYLLGKPPMCGPYISIHWLVKSTVLCFMYCFKIPSLLGWHAHFLGYPPPSHIRGLWK